MARTSFSYDDIITKITRICKAHKIKLILNDASVPENNGISYGNDEIHLGQRYTSNLIMLAIFFHELGHCMLSKRKPKRQGDMPIFREETMAWVLAMEQQIKHFKKPFTKSQGNFMLECLSTYSKQHYNFTKTYEIVPDNDDDD